MMHYNLLKNVTVGVLEKLLELLYETDEPHCLVYVNGIFYCVEGTPKALGLRNNYIALPANYCMDLTHIDNIIDEYEIWKSQVIFSYDSDGFFIIPEDNIDAIKWLIEKYDSIDYDIFDYELKKLGDLSKVTNFIMSEALKNITGFGLIDKCALCKSVSKIDNVDESVNQCEFCIHSTDKNLERIDNVYCRDQSTYIALDKFKGANIDDFITLIQERKNYIQNILDEYMIKLKQYTEFENEWKS